MKRAAIVGFGCAGYHTAKALREAGYEGEIVVYSDLDLPPSNPMLTTYYVSGAIPYEKQFVFGDLNTICSQLNLTWRGGTAVTKIDAAEGTIRLSDGSKDAFDKVAVCTGAVPFVPNIPGAQGPRVFYMRTIEDAQRLKQAIESGNIKRAVVVGASMVGIKVAELLKKAGVSCLLNDGAPNIFPLAALPETAQFIQTRLEALGFEQKYGSGIAAIEPSGDGVKAVFSDGTQVQTDIVVLCIGTRAAVSMVDPTQIAVDRGILVDEYMQTSAPNVYAAGDCSQGKDLLSGQAQIIGLWANAAAQGRTAGRHMAGDTTAYQGNITHNITHFLDLDFFSCGNNRAKGETVTIPLEGGLVELLVEDGKICCINILNNPRISGVIKQTFIKQLLSSGSSYDPKAAAALKINQFPCTLYERMVGEL